MLLTDRIYIASEYAPDGSLSKWLKFNGGKAPNTEVALQMTRGILSGLSHLHSKGIIHRDLKPENILLQAETPRIADFGIARLIQSTSHSTNAVGTPSFMAPECFYGTRSEQTDIWAAGVIFHLLLTGKQPFPQPDQISVMNAIINALPEIDPSIPLNYQLIIQTALMKEPHMRYQSVSDLLNDLQENGSSSKLGFSSFSVTTAPDAETETETQVIQKPSRKNGGLGVIKRLDPWLIRLAALGLLLLGFGMISVFLGFRKGGGGEILKTDSNQNTNQNSFDATTSEVVLSAETPQNSNSNSAPIATNKQPQNGTLPVREEPVGEGYEPWQVGTSPPVGGSPPVYSPPSQPTVKIPEQTEITVGVMYDAENNRCFNDNGVLVRCPWLGPSPTTNPKTSRPVNGKLENSVVRSELSPESTPKPITSPKNADRGRLPINQP